MQLHTVGIGSFDKTVFHPVGLNEGGDGQEWTIINCMF